MQQTNGFWSTLEVHCACADFQYSQYLDMHIDYKISGKPLSITQYTRFKSFINFCMQEDIDNGTF